MRPMSHSSHTISPGRLNEGLLSQETQRALIVIGDPPLVGFPNFAKSRKGKILGYNRTESDSKP